MYIHTFLLCRRLSADTWQRIREAMYDDAKRGKYRIYQDKKKTIGVHIVYERFREEGVIFSLHQYPITLDEKSCSYYCNYSLTIRVNPYILINHQTYIDLFDLTDDNIMRLIDKINQCLSCLGNHIPDSDSSILLRQFLFNDFHFKRIDLSMNLELPSYYMAQQIMKLIHKCRVPQRFKRYQDISEEYNPFEMIYCNSVSVTAYLKIAQMENQTRMSYSETDLERGCSLIRFEVHLMSGKIQGLINKEDGDESSPEKVLSILKDDRYFFYYIDKVFLSGDYRTYQDTIDIITSSSYKNKTKERMQELVDWTNKHNRTLEIALNKSKEKYKYSNAQILSLLEKFDKLEINPVTLPLSVKGHYCIPGVSRLLRQDIII